MRETEGGGERGGRKRERREEERERERERDALCYIITSYRSWSK